MSYPRTDYTPPTSWDDDRAVRIMWLWSALNRQVQQRSITEQIRDEIMHDCFPPDE